MSTYTTSATGVLEVWTIKELNPELFNVMLIGIIIAKQPPRKFQDNKTTDESKKYRAVYNFTLRDSPRDYINVTYWGSEETIFASYEKFAIGDIVELIKPTITIRKLNDVSEEYRPIVTSPYSLTLGDQSEINFFYGNYIATYRELLNYPTKPIAGYVPIRDIQSDGSSLRGRSIDILGAVHSIGNLRTITTKKGQEAQLREVIVFDRTCPGIKITFWEIDVILRAARWQPRSTILFITDISVEWSNFHRCYSASLTSRSVVTENPIGDEATALREYAESSTLDCSLSLDYTSRPLPDISTIQNVMCIKQFARKIEAMYTNNLQNQQELAALLFAVVTKLDLDGQSPNIITKCGFCKKWLKNESCPCANVECPVSGQPPENVQIAFDIKVNLSDHSGTLENCRLVGETAEKVFGFSIKQFLKMSDDEKCHLKWKYLMERCAVHVIAFNNVNRVKPYILILNCSKADPIETAQRISLS